MTLRAGDLVGRFRNNFEKYESYVDTNVVEAAPRAA